MQTEHYIFFAVVILSSLWKLLSLVARIYRLKRSFAFYVICQCAPNHSNSQTPHLSFPRRNLILARGRSSVRPETRTHSELWCESGIESVVRYRSGAFYLNEQHQNAASQPPFAFSFAWWILSPFSVWILLSHHTCSLIRHSLIGIHKSCPLQIRSLNIGTLVGPLSSPSFRQGPEVHIPFFDLPAIKVHRDGTCKGKHSWRCVLYAGKL